MHRNVLIVGNRKNSEDISLILSPLVTNVETAYSEIEVEKKSKKKDIAVIIFDSDSYLSSDDKFRRKITKAIQNSGKDFIIISSERKIGSILDAKALGAKDFIIKPFNEREIIARFNAVINNKKRISCIGGGTGLFNILMGFKTIPNILLTSLVSTADDGGSSGKLKASFGILPPGDIRRSLVALSNAPELMNQVMQYRFEKGGDLKGHNFGNLFLTALAEIKGSILNAVKDLSDLLYIQGIVIPISPTRTTLCAEFEDGTIIKKQTNIDTGKGRDINLRVKRLWHEPPTECDIDAYSCIINSDIVTIGPGDLFTSVITNLVISGVRDALIRSSAKKIYICNLMTKPGETANYDACQHIKEIIKYLGKDCLDYAVISDTHISDEAKREYLKKGQVPVKAKNIDQIKKITKAEIVLADVSHETELVRHDDIKIKNVINEIIKRGK